MAIISLCQASAESLWWLDVDFFCGPFLEACLLPILFRGVSGQVYPSLLYDFWKRQIRKMGSQLVEQMLPALWPSSKVLHHNVAAVAVLMRLLSEEAGESVHCLRDASRAGHLMLLGRAYYCVPTAWELVTSIVQVDPYCPFSLSEFVTRLHPHALEIVRECRPHARNFFNKTNLLDRNHVDKCPSDDSTSLAIAIFCAPSMIVGDSFLKRASNRGQVFGYLLSLCGEDLGQCSRLVTCDAGIEKLDDISAAEFCLQKQTDDASVWEAKVLSGPLNEEALQWARHLTDPWYRETQQGWEASKACINAAVDRLCQPLEFESPAQAAQCTDLQWISLAQACRGIPDSVAEKCSEFAQKALVSKDWQIEVGTLKHVFACCSNTAFASLSSDELMEAIQGRFDDISTSLGDRDAGVVLHGWAQVALGPVAWNAGLAPKCIGLLLHLENNHYRFQVKPIRAF